MFYLKEKSSYCKKFDYIKRSFFSFFLDYFPVGYTDGCVSTVLDTIDDV